MTHGILFSHTDTQHKHTHAYTHKNSHTYTHTRTHINTRTHAHTPVSTVSDTFFFCVGTHTRIHTHARTHICAHAHYVCNCIAKVELQKCMYVPISIIHACMHMCACTMYTHISTHTLSHTRTHTHTHSFYLSLALSLSRARALYHTHTHTHPHTHTHRAKSISLSHPFSGEQLTISAPLPRRLVCVFSWIHMRLCDAHRIPRPEDKTCITLCTMCRVWVGG